MKQRLDTVLKLFIWIYMPIVLLTKFIVSCAPIHEVTFYYNFGGVCRDQMIFGLFIPYVDVYLLVIIITIRYIIFGKTILK